MALDRGATTTDRRAGTIVGGTRVRAELLSRSAAELATLRQQGRELAGAAVPSLFLRRVASRALAPVAAAQRRATAMESMLREGGSLRQPTRCVGPGTRSIMQPLAVDASRGPARRSKRR